MDGTCILPAAQHLKPLVQGNLSRLCGLYSVLNAIQLAVYPQRLHKPDLQALYLRGVTRLAARRQLRSVLGIGMYEDAWLSLAETLVEQANDAHGSALELRQVITGPARRSRKRALEALRSSVRHGSPVLVSLGGALDHYTVISGYTQKRFLLFDSSGLHWLASDRIGLQDHSPRRHWVSGQGVVAIHHEGSVQPFWNAAE